MKVSVIIPTYNEAKTIGWLVKKIRNLAGIGVIVVDDGSTDKTDKIARESGAMVFRNEKNSGKGTALKIAFDYCISDSTLDAVITMDGDGQHNPDEIIPLVEFAKKTGADVVVGNRMGTPREMPFVRRVTNKFMSAVISVLIQEDIPDTQCGFRLLKMSILKNLSLKSSNFEIESEILIQAVRKGYIVKSFPIKTIYSPEISSQINPLIDTARFLKFIFKAMWQ
jgi:glycosyltransferase involved in cell wall biosynthesis